MTEVANVAVRCLLALEQAGLRCALGGALALGIWSPPRATLDVDLNVFIETDSAEAALAPLMALGAVGDVSLLVNRLRAGEVAMLRLDGVRIDVFLPSIPFYETAAQRIERVQFSGSSIPVLSAEVLCVFKLLFFRGKDIVDLERLVAFRGTAIDHAWVRSEVAAMLGEDDGRVAAWDRIIANHLVG